MKTNCILALDHSLERLTCVAGDAHLTGIIIRHGNETQTH